MATTAYQKARKRSIPESVTIPLCDGKPALVVLKAVKGSYGIHEALDPRHTGWVVTHIASGVAVASARGLADARKCAAMLADVHPDPLADDREALRADIEGAGGFVGCSGLKARREAPAYLREYGQGPRGRVRLDGIHGVSWADVTPETVRLAMHFAARLGRAIKAVQGGDVVFTCSPVAEGGAA